MKKLINTLRESISDFLIDHSVGVFYVCLVVGIAIILLSIYMHKNDDINKKVVTIEPNGDRVVVYNPAYEYNSYDVDYTEDYELCRIIITYTKK